MMENDWPDEIESPEDTAVKRLLRVARQVASCFNDNDDVTLTCEFEQAIEEVESFFEKNDPMSDGWIGSDGLP